MKTLLEDLGMVAGLALVGLFLLGQLAVALIIASFFGLLFLALVKFVFGVSI